MFFTVLELLGRSCSSEQTGADPELEYSWATLKWWLPLSHRQESWTHGVQLPDRPPLSVCTKTICARAAAQRGAGLPDVNTECALLYTSGTPAPKALLTKRYYLWGWDLYAGWRPVRLQEGWRHLILCPYTQNAMAAHHVMLLTVDASSRSTVFIRHVWTCSSVAATVFHYSE